MLVENAYTYTTTTIQPTIKQLNIENDIYYQHIASYSYSYGYPVFQEITVL